MRAGSVCLRQCVFGAVCVGGAVYVCSVFGAVCVYSVCAVWGSVCEAVCLGQYVCAVCLGQCVCVCVCARSVWDCLCMQCVGCGALLGASGSARCSSVTRLPSTLLFSPFSQFQLYISFGAQPKAFDSLIAPAHSELLWYLPPVPHVQTMIRTSPRGAATTLYTFIISA